MSERDLRWHMLNEHGRRVYPRPGKEKQGGNMKTRQKIGMCMALPPLMLAAGFVLWMIVDMIRMDWKTVVFGTLIGLALCGLVMGGAYLINTGADKEAR